MYTPILFFLAGMHQKSDIQTAMSMRRRASESARPPETEMENDPDLVNFFKKPKTYIFYKIMIAKIEKKIHPLNYLLLNCRTYHWSERTASTASVQGATRTGARLNLQRQKSAFCQPLQVCKFRTLYIFFKDCGICPQILAEQLTLYQPWGGRLYLLDLPPSLFLIFFHAGITQNILTV